MSSKWNIAARILRGSCLLAVSLAACTPTTALTVPTEKATPSPVPTGTPIPTSTIPLAPTATLGTPPPLPVPYQNDSLTPFGSPHTNIQDQCKYIQDKWSSKNSPPGTVVMTIMFHSISGDTSGSTISDAGFQALMQELHEKDFQTITTSQLADFLDSNTKIPARSVLLILDDRRPGTVALDFMPYLKDYNWTLTLAWPIGAGDDSTDKKPATNVLPGEAFTSLWQQMEAYYATGRLDIQAHGVNHNIIMGPDSSDEFLHGELQGSIDAIQKHFKRAPIAIIWPGGGFTQRAAEVARQLGYRLGFTVNPRGPVMFNWVPLADKVQEERVTWLPEGPVDDPLMVLPRYWDTDAITHIDEVIQIGQEAAAYAGQNKTIEMEYYNIACEAHYGPIP